MVAIATLRQRVFEPERGKLLGGMRQQIDADADRLDLGRGLEDAAGNAGRVQRQPERQAADAAADDDECRPCFLPGDRQAICWRDETD